MKPLRVAMMLSLSFLCQLKGASAAETKMHTIVIEAMRFTPQSVEVGRGDTITWVNKDIFPHNVTATAAGFRSKELAPGESWTFKAAKKGSFPYRCTLHPTMEANLTVK